MYSFNAYQKVRRKFLFFWERNGQPHPSSNAYIEMTRIFYWTEGYNAGLKEKGK